MIKVTVYIPSYNYGKFLKQSIQSVLNQKYDDWQLIVIDDGSTDNTRHILEEFRAHSKLTIIHQEKKGLPVSNNIALRMSQGTYIMRLDADDYLDENALLVLSNILDTHPDVGLVYPDYYRVDEDNCIIDIERRKKIGEEVELLDIPAHGACTMLRKSCLLELGGYNESLTCQDGYDLWIKFIHKFKPYNVNVPLFYYRQHHLSLTQDKSKILSTRHHLQRTFVKDKFGNQIPKVMAIIPVRKEIGPIPNLALQKCAGKYFLDFTIEEALKTNLLDKIVVTSEDQDVLGYIKKFPKVIGIQRSSNLALVNSRIEPTVDFVLDTLKKREQYVCDAVMLLYPHTPLRKYVHIEKAIDTMLIFDVDSVISVTEVLKVFYQHTKQGLSPLMNKRMLRLEREALYEENGAIYLSKTSHMTKDNFLSSKLGHVIMLPEESLKVDSKFNFWLIEKVLYELHRS